MEKKSTSKLGTESIASLLIKQALPASIGILVMSLNILVDTIFVGQWIGTVAIAAINVVLPVSFFIGALGMAIGIGGSSIISRALGAGEKEKALFTFGNQVVLTLGLSLAFASTGLYFADDLIPAFGGKGEIFTHAKTYYITVLYGIPFLSFVMMGNTVVRAEGKPKFAMFAMLIPSVGNLVMDYVFIYHFDYGMQGAAWATTGSYVLCFAYIFWFFRSKHSELKLKIKHLVLQFSAVKEIAALGFVTLARQATVSITYLLINNILFGFGGATSVAVYAIISRMLMFALFPILGITQGFLPIAGYNYGAKYYKRVEEVIKKAISYAVVLATLVFALIMIFPEAIASAFTKDMTVVNETASAMRWVFVATPIIALQLIGAAYFQAVGKAIPALLLTLTRQGFFFIPLVLILPNLYGEFGVWISFGLSDLLATIVTAYFLNREVVLKLKRQY